MDFLKIRKKAKARSAEVARPADPSVPAEPAQAPPPANVALPPVLPARSPPPPPPVPSPALPPVPAQLTPPGPATEADALEGALAARLQGLPPVEAGFTTWRPGTGAPPPLTPSPALEDPLQPSDFALVRPPETSAREALLPPVAAPSASPAPRPPETPREPAGRAAPVDPLEAFFYRDDEDAPPLPGFEPGSAVDPLTATSADAREEYITFLLGAEEYAVAIERVREVMRCPPVTEVPRAPPHVRGVVSVRGEVVAVVEPRRRLGLPESGRGLEGSRLLVVDVGDGPVGLLVDAVSSVVRLRPGSIEPCPQGIGGTSQELLAGIGRERDRLFTVLDLGALLRRAPSARRRPEGTTRAG